MSASRKIVQAMVVLILAAFGAVTWAASDVADEEENEEQITIEQLPEAVKLAVMKAARGARIREVERETEDGKTTYEVELVIETEIEIELAEDGTIIELEIERPGDDDDDDDGDDDDN